MDFRIAYGTSSGFSLLLKTSISHELHAIFSLSTKGRLDGVSQGQADLGPLKTARFCLAEPAALYQLPPSAAAMFSSLSWFPLLLSLTPNSQSFLFVKGIQFPDQAWASLTHSLQGLCRSPTAQSLKWVGNFRATSSSHLSWFYKWLILHPCAAGVPLPRGRIHTKQRA